MRKRNSSKRAQAQQSFENIIAQQTLNKFKPYIDQQIMASSQATVTQIRQLLTRSIALETLLFEAVPDLTQEKLSFEIPS